MRGILKCIYAHEFWVVLKEDVLDGSLLDLPWPFEIPPDYDEDAVAACGMQTGVAVCNANGCLGYKVGNQTCLENSVGSKGAFDEE